MRAVAWTVVPVALALACAGGPGATGSPTPQRGGSRATPADATAAREPIRPPVEAYLAGFMPLASTGVLAFLAAHPAYDGRGVLIAILDSGVDPAAPGLVETSTGAPKLLDARDFSGEGRVALAVVTPDANGRVVVSGRSLAGAGRVRRVAAGDVWYGGVFRELPLGTTPAADINGNGTNTDEFPLVVVRATDGWAAFMDTNRDGSLDDEMPLHDYRQGRETLALGTRPLTLAANFVEDEGRPVLDLYFDTQAHGTHVAGIAAGYNLYDVAGFHGVAPGAQLLGLKIANNARGGLTTHGSLARAMAYAERFARERALPLVLNLSFGVGNEREGRAAMDSMVNAFIAAHPEVVFVVSAGNDGPGISTVGLPASADRALTVGATFPGPFTKALDPGEAVPADRLGWWSARGGDLAKPDLVAPGIAYSAVPGWSVGNEVKGGTSMAAPYVAGLAACLVSAMVEERRAVRGADVVLALTASARPLPGVTVVDQGAGVPDLEAAYAWLAAGHQGSSYAVRATSGASAALRTKGLAGPGDTIEVFRVIHLAGLRAARYALQSDVPWLRTPDVVTAEPGTTTIAVRYQAAAFSAPGLYVGTVTARNPSDPLAGALFRLVNTIAVPYELRQRALVDARRDIAAGAVQRYFLRVTQAEASIAVTVALADSVNQTAIVRLYEPGGRPFRDVEEVALGDEDPGTAQIVVRAEDLVPGVYELTVVAPPLEPVTVAVRAEVSAAALALSEGALEVSNLGSSVLSGSVHTELVGAVRSVELRGRGFPAESLAVRVPDWAEQAEIDFVLPTDRWEEFTDFGLTVFDSAGQILMKAPLNYAVARQRVAVAERHGSALVVELFPAYARTDRAPPWGARVTVRFLAKRSVPQGDARAVTVVPGGRVRVPLSIGNALPAPPGFDPLVRVTLGTAVRRGPIAAGR